VGHIAAGKSWTFISAALRRDTKSAKLHAEKLRRAAMNDGTATPGAGAEGEGEMTRNDKAADRVCSALEQASLPEPGPARSEDEPDYLKELLAQAGIDAQASTVPPSYRRSSSVNFIIG
jgi:hypothetical protein